VPTAVSWLSSSALPGESGMIPPLPLTAPVLSPTVTCDAAGVPGATLTSAAVPEAAPLWASATHGKSAVVSSAIEARAIRRLSKPSRFVLMVLGRLRWLG